MLVLLLTLISAVLAYTPAYETTGELCSDMTYEEDKKCTEYARRDNDNGKTAYLGSGLTPMACQIMVKIFCPQFGYSENMFNYKTEKKTKECTCVHEDCETDTDLHNDLSQNPGKATWRLYTIGTGRVCNQMDLYENDFNPQLDDMEDLGP